MAATLTRRLAEILGSDLSDLTESQLEALIGRTEGDDFEVKSENYGRGDSQKRELCADVAAFANGRGGLLLVGASEKGDVVDALTPVDTEGAELWVRQVLASGIVPPLQVVMKTIPSIESDGLGYLAIGVGASADAPHAVVNNDDLRYVVRDGQRKRPMREPEVADQHRRRVVAAATRLERLDVIQRSIRSHTAIAEESTWLTVCSVPDKAGRFEINTATRREVSDWVSGLPGLLPIPAALSGLNGSFATTGFRRFILGDHRMANGKPPTTAVAELHADGALALSINVGWQRKQLDDHDDESALVPDLVVPFYLIAGLLLAGRWAERTGSEGQANVSAFLETTGHAALVHNRQSFLQQLPGTRRLTGTTERDVFTCDTDDLATPGPDLVAVAALIANDIFNAFGAGQCLQLAPDGSLRMRYIDRDYQSLVGGWASEANVVMSQETIG